MNYLNSYPKIYQLGHPNIKELFEDEIVIQEKIDGSQISWCKINGELKIKSHHKMLDIGNPDKMFIKAVAIIKGLDLHDGWVYRGEYLSIPNHNTLKYDRVPKNNIILFDINTDIETYLDYNDVVKEGNRIGLETVKLFSISKIDNVEDIKKLLDSESMLGGTKIEGIVFKNYKRFGKDKKVLMGKYVSESFKEKHGTAWKEKNPSTGDIIVDLGKEFKIEARWNKAIHHLKESGSLTDTVKDIGGLIKEIRNDIKEEENEYIKLKLYIYAINKILRIATSGFPEWYKDKLAENQFE